MRGELATIEEGAAPAAAQHVGINSVRETMETLKAIRTFVKEEMIAGLDYGVIPGTGKKPALLQPGAQKTAMLYNACPNHVCERVELGNGHLEVLVTTQLINRASGAMIGSGLGSCSSMESRYRFRHEARKCPSCGAEAIIKGKEEYGGGWICFKKKGGCGAKFDDGDRSVEGQAVGTVENENPHDQRNTVLKMAIKRSFVAASLSLGCLSELFTQDIDETYDLDATAHQAVAHQAVAHQAAHAPDDSHQDARREVNEAFPAKGQQQSNQQRQEDVPRSGKALFARVKELEEKHQVGMLKYINGWAKLQDFTGRMIDWDAEQVALAHAECVRRIRSITGEAAEAAAAERQPSPAQPAESPSASVEPWASFVARACRTANDDWKNEQAMMASPPQGGHGPLTNQHAAANEVCTRAIAKGLIRAEDVAKDGTPDGPRDPMKMLRKVVDLYDAKPGPVRATVEAYLAEKLAEARRAAGGDHDAAAEDAYHDAKGQDAAEDQSQVEEAEAGARG